MSDIDVVDDAIAEGMCFSGTQPLKAAVGEHFAKCQRTNVASKNTALERRSTCALGTTAVMAAISIASSVIIFFTSSLEAPRSYLDGILKNPSRLCAVFQRRAWRESLFMSSVVELHIYGVCDTAVLHDVNKSLSG